MTDAKIERKIGRIAAAFGIVPGKASKDMLFVGELERKPRTERRFELRKWALKKDGTEITGRAIRLNENQMYGLREILNDMELTRTEDREHEEIL